MSKRTEGKSFMWTEIDNFLQKINHGEFYFSKHQFLADFRRAPANNWKQIAETEQAREYMWHYAKF